MPLVKILQNYQNAEGWKAGDVVDVTEPTQLIAQNKVALVDKEGKVVSQDESTARKFIERLGREESANLAFDILRKLDLLDSLMSRPVTAKITAASEASKTETPKKVEEQKKEEVKVVETTAKVDSKKK